jgi:phenylacetate-CoA ligase
VIDTVRSCLSTLNKLRLLPLTLQRAHRSPAAQARLQLRLLRRVIERAYDEVPLYRRKLDAAGLHPRDLRTLGDLARFPITEKDEIRDAFPDGAVARGTDLSHCRIQQTSGSSGQCMEIALDSWSDDARTLYTQRMYGMHGFRFWRRMAYLFPYPLPLRRNLGLYRNRHISTQLPPEQILHALREFRPHLLAATPSDLLELCDATTADLRELGLRAVCVHSEPISPDERLHLQTRFGCPVATNYYCNEVWAIASECPAGRMHQFPDSVVLEIVDDAGRPVAAGETGHVLVTSLHNRVQPFIRYRLGDLAAWDASPAACPCGLRLPRLARIDGRDDDYITVPDGRRIHPSRITVAVKSPCFAHPGAQIFRDYRITQDGPAHVTIQIVPGRDREAFEHCAASGRANLERLLGVPFRVDVKRVDKLDRGSGGKRKIVERALVQWETQR